MTSWLFISMMLLWTAKYFFAGNAYLMKFESWIGSDEPMHLSLGFFIPLCMAWLLRIYRMNLRLQAGFFALIALAFASDEYFQSWVPFRSSTWVDFQMSITGWGLAMLVWFCLWFLLFRPTREAMAEQQFPKKNDQ